MWTATTRAQHRRDGRGFASDLTDTEWAVLEPLLPARPDVGRPRRRPMREIVNAIVYVLRGGTPWRMLPPCFPPRQTVYGWFAAWRDAGVWQSINHRLVMLDRERVGREASPSAAVIDSQSVKTTEAGGLRGYDAGKKINGRKRHAMVDTDGRAMELQVGPASVQDRDGAVPLLKASRRRFRFVERAFADTAYAAERVRNATSVAIEIVRKIPGQVGFEVHPRRWVVERCFAWLGRNRRLARDFEATIASATAFLYAASAMLLVRRPREFRVKLQSPGGKYKLLTPTQGGLEAGNGAVAPVLTPGPSLTSTHPSGEFGGDGTLFQQVGTVQTILHGFSGPDGAGPDSTPVLTPTGSLIGTTYAGGAACSCGTIYEYVP